MSEDFHEFVLQAVAYDNAELLAELLAERPHLANCHGAGDSRTPLHHAAAAGHAKCAALLIACGADVDAVAGPQDTVKTPLGLASSMGHCAVVELLVTNAADLFYVDSDGHSALQLAQIGAHHSVAALLMGTIERIYAEAEHKNQRLCAACVDGEVGQVLDILSDLGPKSTRKQILNGRCPGEQKSALFLAAEHGRADIVQALLTVQYHSIIFEPSGDTILHAAIASQDVATVELIAHKFPFLMDAANEERSLPLHWACRCGNAGIVHALLTAEYPAEELKFFSFRHPQQQQGGTRAGSTGAESSRGGGRDGPCSSEGEEEEGYLFVCDLNAADQERRSAFFLAVLEGHSEVVQLLAKYTLPICNGTSSNSRRHQGGLRHANVEQQQEQQQTMDHPIVFDWRVKGRTPLMVACANGSIEIVRILLEQCHVDVNYCPPPAMLDVDNDTAAGGCGGGSALAEATNSGHLGVVRALFGQGAFDYGNRTLRAMLLANQSGRYCASSIEMVGLFLQQLAQLDNEPCASSSSRSLRQKDEGQQQGSAAGHSRVLPIVESWLSNVSKVSAPSLSGTDCCMLSPAKCCQLNWQTTGIRELRSEWMVDAVLRLNPQMPRHLGKSLAFGAITRVDLSSNHLCAVPHFLFTHLPSLRSLNLSKNGIHRLEMPPNGEHWQMPSLERLYLDENQLEELPKQLFSAVHLPRLSFLYAFSNRLRRLPPAVWTAPRLRELHLANNLIGELNGATGGAGFLPQELRRGSHLMHRTTAGITVGTGGASAAARISRQRQREAREASGSRSAAEVENEDDRRQQQRQSRSMLKRRESPSQHQQAAKDGGGGQVGTVSKSGHHQSTVATDKDEEENSSNATTPRGGGGEGDEAATTTPMVVEMDIQRVNVWQEKIHVSNIDEDGPTTTDEGGAAVDGQNIAGPNGGGTNVIGTPTTTTQSQLQLLNLAHNKFFRMPTCLACCCPRLAKLDLSSNALSGLGPVGCLPSALRHLDVSNNQLVRLFGGENPAQLRQKLRFCEVQPGFRAVGAQYDAGGTAASNMPMARHSRSRSKSVARSQRSLSVVRKSGGAGAAGDGHQQQCQTVVAEQELLLLNSTSSCCVHKSHCRLEALKTLNLTHNLLEFLEILLPMGGENSTMFISGPVNDAENEEGTKQFNWRENSELLKPFVLFPALTSLDLSVNRIRQLPPTISLLNSLAMLNLANNAELDSLVPELGLLERLWTIGLNGCQLRAEEPTLQAVVKTGRYKTGEVLSQLRQRLENSMPYPMLKLMLLGGPSVGKSTLLQQIRLETASATPKRRRGSQQNDVSWGTRRRHSPITPPATTTSSTVWRGHSQSRFGQHRPPPPSPGTVPTAMASSVYPVDVFEWVYEPPRQCSSSSSSSTAAAAKSSNITSTTTAPTSQHSSTTAPAATADSFHGPITFRVWDFDGIKQREYQSVQRCFFTRRCLFLLLWKVTDGDIALVDLHDYLLAIQAQAPNSCVLIVGTHSDFVREQTHRFSRDYLSQMDRQIQERFILGADPEKNGLPRVLGSLYISCCSREDVRSLCAFIYTCATEIRQFSRGGGTARQRLLAQKVPASFVSLEHIVATMVDEFRAVGREPIMPFNDLWRLATDRLSQRRGDFGGGVPLSDPSSSATPPPPTPAGDASSARTATHFRGAHDFRQACLFLHENGTYCLCLVAIETDDLHGILAFAALRRRSSFGSVGSSPFVTLTSLSQMHQNSVIESVELYTALKRAVRQNLALLFSSGLSRPSAADVPFTAHFRLFRLCVMSLLRKFELALPFQYGRMSLLAACLPDEYVLRADYPGSKVLVRNKFDKLRIRWNVEKQTAAAPFEGSTNAAAAARAQPLKMSPIHTYLQHRRLSRAAVGSSIDHNLNHGGAVKLATEPNSGGMGECGGGGENNNDKNRAGLIRILAIDQCKEECLRRLYVMHYIPPGFWARLSTRLLDDERVGHALAKLFLIGRASSHPPAVYQQQQQMGSSAVAETDEQQKQHQQQQQMVLSSSSPETIVAAFSRALNAGRIVNLAQRDAASSFKWGISGADQAENMPEEEETSFIVVNSADEVTEEFSFSPNKSKNKVPKKVPSSPSDAKMVIKCCERGVEATVADDDDEQCHSTSGGISGSEQQVAQQMEQQQQSGINALEWMVWRSGVEVRCFGTFVLSLRQFLPLASVSDVNYASHELRRRFEEGQWATLSTPAASADQPNQQQQNVSPLSHMVELLIPKVRMRLRWHDTPWEMETDSRMAARLLSLITGAVDDLLEDAYPQLGTRFILSPQGRPLVDRLVPCDRCAVEAIREEERYWLRENINRNPAGQAEHGNLSSLAFPHMTKSSSTTFKSDNTSGGPKRMGASRVPKSKSSTETPLNRQQQQFVGNTKLDDKGAANSNKKSAKDKTTAYQQPVYLFGIEECIVEARRQFRNVEQRRQKGSATSADNGGGDGGCKQEQPQQSQQSHQCLECPRHGIVRPLSASSPSPSLSTPIVPPDLYKMAPDLLFVDLENKWVVPSECIQRGALVGRGAFGFVFTGKLAFVPASSPSAFRKKMMTVDQQDNNNRQRNASGEDAAIVALKQFEPIEPCDGDTHGLAMFRTSAQAAIRAFALKWQHDRLEQITRAYCTARQELCMLSELRHSHCTSMVAFCPCPPMTLLMELAPHGSLNNLLADYRRIGQRLHVDTVQMCCVQIARALEYLHVQQHIIYRDLKSENVLVWHFPLPSQFSDRSAKRYSPRDVLVKLGDYGISRFSHPFGMCKGYGGTEGFMAPEIMRYNGEQEYSERVDCFSFGMFIYELLTLRQPYEGQPVQQMKERILEAQRPAVNEKELLFATNMLDLMIACWEERAERRPSSSQLVEICSAPEFSHLLDVALLRESEAGTGTAAICLLAANSTTHFANNEWACWMPIGVDSGSSNDGDVGKQRQQHQLADHQQQRQQTAFLGLLKCNQFGWTEKKQISSMQNDRNWRAQTRVTTIAQVYDEFVWVGDEMGTLGIFELDDQHLMLANPAAPPLYKIDCIKMLLESEESGGGGQSTKTAPEKDGGEKKPLQPSSLSTTMTAASAASAVRRIDTFRERRLVIVGLTVAVLLYRWHGRDNAPQLVCCVRLNPIPSLGSADGTAAHLFSMAVLRSLSDWQLWTGHAAGHIFMHFISSTTDRLAFSTSANHYAMAESADDNYLQRQQQQTKKQPQTTTMTAQPNRRKVAFLVASNYTKNLAWSAMDQDSRLFMWRDSQLQKTLNSAKILPISESLSSMDNFSTNFHPSCSTYPDGIGTQQNSTGAAVFVTALEVLALSSCCDTDGHQQKRNRTAKDGEDDNEDEEQLLVGTNNGVVLIVRGIEMSPLSAFRPYLCAVERLICCPTAGHHSSASSRILQKELLLSPSSKTHHSSQVNPLVSQHSVPPPNVDKRRQSSSSSKKRSLLLLEKSRSLMLKATGSSATGGQQSTAAGDNDGQSLKMSASTSMHGVQMVSDFRNAAVSAVDELCETVRDGMRGIFMPTENAEAATCGDAGGGTAKKRDAREAFFVSVGRGYRPLLNRFVSSAEINALLNKHKEESCAIFWRSTREWAASSDQN